MAMTLAIACFVIAYILLTSTLYAGVFYLWLDGERVCAVAVGACALIVTGLGCLVIA